MLDTVKEILRNRRIRKFLISSLVILIFWVILTSIFPETLYQVHFWTILPQAHVSKWILQIFGFSVEVMYNVNNCQALLDLNNEAVVCIGTGCSGVELYLLFGIFVILFKGQKNTFLWYIPAGILGISILNIIRIVALSLIAYHAPEYLDFNHKYTFTIIVYGFLIGLWLYWMNRFYVEK